MKTNEVRADHNTVNAILAAQKGEPVTLALSSGSPFPGERRGVVADLVATLSAEPLDSTFENYGNFITADPVGLDDKPLYPAGFVNFWGNFVNVSHVFNIVTNEPEVIAELTRLIRANQATPAYLAHRSAAQRRTAPQGGLRHRRPPEHVREILIRVAEILVAQRPRATVA
jgi:hypothetical protein